MKRIWTFAGIGLVGGMSLCAFQARATMEIGPTVEIRAKAEFDASLAVHGSWLNFRSYGRCWRPVGVAVEWRPYGDGQWVWTDCGWYWQSDEPWAWACYHYGRWVYDLDLGWVWIPDIDWAPAWVCWRTGGGYVGWAPSPPAGIVIEPRLFAFVGVGHFRDRVRARTLILNDTKIVSQTTFINNIRQESRTIGGAPRKVMINEGPGIEGMQKATEKEIKPVPIQEAARHAAGLPVLTTAHQQANPGKTPPSSPKLEPRLNPKSTPPTKLITPNVPGPKGVTVSPREQHFGGRDTPPDFPAHASPAKPAKPAVGYGGRDPQKDKGNGHDQDKS